MARKESPSPGPAGKSGRRPRVAAARAASGPEQRLRELEAERAALQQALRDSEQARQLIERARREWVTALDAIDDPLFIHDAEMRVVRANQAYARCAGLDIHEVVGRRYWEMFPRLGRPLDSCRHTLDTHQASEELVRLEDGTEIVSRAFPIHDENGAYLYSLHLLHDITAQRRAEAEQRVLSEALRQAAEAVVVLDQEKRITFLNPAFYELFGYAPEEIIGQPVSILDAPGQGDDRQPLGVIRQLPGVGSWRGEVMRRARDGSAIPIFISATAIHDPRGLVVGYVATYLDLREQQRAEEALRTSGQRYRALIENASDLITLIDGDAVTLYHSPSIERLLGYDRDELVGHSIFEKIHPQDHERVAKTFREALLHPGVTYVVQLRVRAKNGTYRYFETVGCNLLDDPAVGGVVINSRDVTDRHQAEESLRKVNRALRVLSAGNAALVHTTSEHDLLQEICRVILDLGGYRIAWVGYVAPDDPALLHVEAMAGIGHADLEAFSGPANGPDAANHPILQAITLGQGKVVQGEDTASLPPRWREFLERHGIASTIHLPLEEDGRVFAVLNICAREPDAFDLEEVNLLAEMVSDLAYGIRALRIRAQRDRAIAEHAQSQERLRENLEDTIAAIAATLEMRDPYTAGHERRVAALATAIARELRLPEERIQGLHVGALIHDLGKISAPAEILSKPSRLTPVEYELIKGHAQAGYDILKGIKFPWPVALMVLQHHERLDGSGYPSGLQDDEILLEARILAVADTVEAMSSHRPYRPAVGIDAALAHVHEMRGRQFDAAVADACLRLFADGAFAFPAAR